MGPNVGGLRTDKGLIENPEIKVPGTKYSPYLQRRAASGYFDQAALAIQAELKALGFDVELDDDVEWKKYDEHELKTHPKDGADVSVRMENGVEWAAASYFERTGFVLVGFGRGETWGKGAPVTEWRYR